MNSDADVRLPDASAPLIPVYDPLIQRSRIFNSALRSIFTLHNFYILLGPLLCALICLFVKLNDSVSGRNMLAVLVWIFSWWLTEAVPMPITAMAPMFLLPLFGIAGADEVARSYSDDVIILILGSFILALAVEHYNIHRRLAFNITLIFCGDPLNPPLLILGICATTAFISMWMSNVAAAVMMMPAATGILQALPSGPTASSHHKDISNFCKAMVLGVLYSATIGGMCTQTGTGVNLILAGIWKSYFPKEDPITFNTWFFFGFPVGLLIFISMWGILCLLYCRRGLGSVLSEYMHKAHLKRELDLLGPITFAEKMILTIFSVLVVLWMTRSITDDIPGWGAVFQGRVSDGTVSVMMATLLFIIPNRRKQGEKLMDWDKCRKLPWNIILLVGAGFAIADGIKTSGLAHMLSEALGFIEEVPSLAVAPIVCLISSIITEFTSDNATATLLIPLLVQVAQTMHVHPLLLMVPCAIGAQFPFVVPTGTPSNIVGFTTGHIEIKDMIKVGLPLKIAGVLVVSILMPTLGPLVFGTEKQIGSSF